LEIRPWTSLSMSAKRARCSAGDSRAETEFQHPFFE
jgi:hypothetical protein